MPKKILYLLVLVCGLSFSQTVSVDDSTYNEQQLANLLLQSSCITANNVSYSSAESVAYFENNGGAFPLAEGIILRSGIASHTAGMYTDTNLSSSINNVNDPDLNAIADAVSGQDANIRDTAFLQFDFTPISENFSFNFIFASNEYGQWQCGFSDVFAFLLTDLGTGVTTNLAVIPNTTTPVAVTTIRDNTYNASCASENPSLFDVYNVGNEASSTINMRGYTASLTASSTLTPGTNYRIRLAIGDFNNSTFDSAVFIDSGSFTTTVNLGDDFSLCSGDNYDLTTGLDENDFNHSWTFNGQPTGGNSNTLNITQAGTYAFTATQNGTTCIIEDEIIVSDISYNNPDNLTLCDDGSGQYFFDLTQNDEDALGLDDNTFNLFYYANQNDIPTNPINGTAIMNYQTDGTPQTIYIKIQNTVTGNLCSAELNFNLSLTPTPTANQPTTTLTACEGDTGTIDLTTINSEVLGSQIPADYTISYFNNQSDAENNQNPISSNFPIPATPGTTTVWIRIESINNTNCFDTTSVQIIITSQPNVTQLSNVLECSQYILPDILQANENYYTSSGGPNGGGQQLNPNDIIDLSGTYYVYIVDNNGCANESSFTVTLIDEYNIEINHCEDFVIPAAIQGVDSNFYTEPNQGGTLISGGTLMLLDSNGNLEYQGLGITIPGNTDTIYYYAEINGVFCTEKAFPITLFEDPPVDQPSDVSTCLSYSLPVLTNGQYVGYNEGDSITQTTTIQITNTQDYPATDVNGNPLPDPHQCTSTHDFTVTIINEPQGVQSCDNYILPTLTIGNYYFEQDGQGVQIPQGSEVQLTNDGNLYFVALDQTISGNTDNIYVFAPDTENTTNCTNNMYFELTIYPTPDVDTSNNITRCVSDGYILPNLTNGNYYTQAGGQGTLIPQGTNITLDGTNDLLYSNGLGVLHPSIGTTNTIIFIMK